MKDMHNNTLTMNVVWIGVGLILFIMGFIILATGLYIVFFHIREHTVLSNLHPDIWWGSLMIIAGYIFLFTHRKNKNKGYDKNFYYST